MNAEPASYKNPALLDIEVNSFATDSREVKAGDLFFAFSQPEFENNGFNGDFVDATRFAASALESGAVACVLRRDRFEEHEDSLRAHKDQLIFADDVIVAFQDLARNVNKTWGKPVVAITGSAGKTTAKELTAHVLAATGKKVLKSERNLNTGLGLPMTVLKLVAEPDFDVAVLEMGMSTPNREIARLCDIAPPDVGIELNVLPVHIEHLGTIDNIRNAKAELVEGLREDGVAVLNADDPRVIGMLDLHDGRAVTYGIENPADVTAVDIEMPKFGETAFTMKMPGGSARVTLPLSGRHNVMNALAAAAAGHCFGMTAREIANALGTVRPPKQRGEVLRFAGGFTVINDSYNSNPDALLKMIATLIEGAPEGSRKVVVAGEMLELGPEEKRIHLETGKKLGGLDIDFLVGVRGSAKDLVDGALEEGQKEAAFCEDSAAAGALVSSVAREGDVILVKGSRGVRTEKVIERLLEDHELAN